MAEEESSPASGAPDGHPSIDQPVRLHLSPSAISEFVDCGKKFYLRRIVGIEGNPAYALAGGRAVHGAIEAFERRALARGKDTQ